MHWYKFSIFFLKVLALSNLIPSNSTSLDSFKDIDAILSSRIKGVDSPYHVQDYLELKECSYRKNVYCISVGKLTNIYFFYNKLTVRKMQLKRTLEIYGGNKAELCEISWITLTQLLEDEPVFALCLHKFK